MKSYYIDNQIYTGQKEYRIALSKNPKYSNSYKKWDYETDQELIKLSKIKKLNDLALHFKRKKGAILVRLELLQNSKNVKITKDSIIPHDPITGEVIEKLDNTSINKIKWEQVYQVTQQKLSPKLRIACLIQRMSLLTRLIQFNNASISMIVILICPVILTSKQRQQ